MSERTIGYVPSTKVIVVAPTHREAQDWANQHGVAFSDTVYVGPVNIDHALYGLRGARHVILSWSRLDEKTRDLVKQGLRVIESVPYEEDPDVPEQSAVADPAPDLRS